MAQGGDRGAQRAEVGAREPRGPGALGLVRQAAAACGEDARAWDGDRVADRGCAGAGAAGPAHCAFEPGKLMRLEGEAGREAGKEKKGS